MEKELLDAIFKEGKSYYEILSVKVDATGAQIKKAYYALALRYHPDRVGKQEGLTTERATANFQELTRIYEVLSNPKKRTLYDQTGSDGDFTNLEDMTGKDWEKIWRSLYAEITEEDIEQFSKEYKKSQQEKDDVIKEYVATKGNFAEMMEKILLADWRKDAKRFAQIINAEIAAGRATRYSKWNKNQINTIINENVRKMDREAKEAEQMMQNLVSNSKNSKQKKQRGGKGKEDASGSNEDDLKKMILQRNQTRASKFDGAISRLEAKYANANDDEEEAEEEENGEEEEEEEEEGEGEEDGEYRDMEGLRNLLHSRSEQRKDRFNDLIGGLEQKHGGGKSGNHTNNKKGSSTASTNNKRRKESGGATTKSEKQRSAKRTKRK
eukprot:TRINITY_DN104_c0_g1_i1.p1 TRINITY_DN104_c0_g1~~TRINITY_DN104_c0_g1_i1.p1  ORF type:complete len:382 (+),score=145.35 TRINITY_DN104_c0_g1_i1:243-1388(+)